VEQGDGASGHIFDIQGFSVHDGPGCRTLIFLAGCPLRCAWCANPEGQHCRPLLFYRRHLCACSSFPCIAACPLGAIEKTGDPPIMLHREHCRGCRDFACARECYREALTLSARLYTLDEVMAVIGRDSAYWGPGGGVTLGGGDPLSQGAFARNILCRCRERYIHTAIETSACFPFEEFLKTVTLADWLFIDVKHMESEAHREATGAGNVVILDNIRRLKRSGWPGRLVIRVPVVPGFNDSEEVIGAIARFVVSAGWGEMNLLPFHRMGESKYGQLGLTYKYAHVASPGEERMRSLQQAAETRGVTCYCGSRTPF